MTITVNRDSFVAAGVNYRGNKVGTIAVNLGGGGDISCRCYIAKNSTFGEEIHLHGFIGRYQTSAKPWLAHVRNRPGSNHVSASFGRDDRSGRFNKLHSISYEPVLFDSMTLGLVWKAASEGGAK